MFTIPNFIKGQYNQKGLLKWKGYKYPNQKNPKSKFRNPKSSQLLIGKSPKSL
jgi:hypothetical protein